MASILFTILVIAPPLLIAVILHEIAHGLVAERLGDPTARSMGRISLNPLVHIDPFLTVVLPLLLIASHSPVVFGGAKPVPINPAYFRNPRKGMLWVAIGGPATNFLLAVVSYLLLILYHMAFGAAAQSSLHFALPLAWLEYSILINVILGVFNLIPIPPLDGGRIAVGLLPLPIARQWAKLERFGIILLFLLLYFGFFRFLSPILRYLPGF